MAMRDPGTPGRNPFFDHGPEPLDEEVAPDAPRAERAAEADAADPTADFWEQDFPWNDTAAGRDPLGTLANLVDALQQVQPEATEHLVAAAHELMLAVKCVVDATEAVLAAQRAEGPPAPPERDPLLRDDVETRAEPERSSPTSGVRRIDLA
jgi:hypothetical protein